MRLSIQWLTPQSIIMVFQGSLPETLLRPNAGIFSPLHAEKRPQKQCC